MTIRINQTPVEFTLEHETTFADLTISLRSWADSQDLAIVGILADGRALGPDDTTPLPSLSAVDVETVSRGERAAAGAVVVSQYFAVLSQAWSQENTALVSELHREYSTVRGALFPLMDPFSARIQDALTVLDGPWTGSSEAAALLAAETEARRSELVDPWRALAETLGELDDSLDSLTDVGLLFQKGNDRSAFDRILRLFLLVEDGERRAELVLAGADRTDWDGFRSDLRPFLKEAEAALAAQDYILLTDLLEYEVTPRLKTLRDLFPRANLDPVKDLL